MESLPGKQVFLEYAREYAGAERPVSHCFMLRPYAPAIRDYSDNNAEI